MIRTGFLLAMLLILMGCSAEPAVDESSTGAQQSPELIGIASGRTAEGAFTLGSPDAPMTIIDYSDFL